MEDPRFTCHSVTVQKLPPSYVSPRKRLSHAVKATPSASNGGTFQAIYARIPWGPGRRRH